MCDNACDLSSENQIPVFDFIVVGSGPAGSAIVNRLVTANRQWKILLIEAGGEPLVDTVMQPLMPFHVNTSSSFNYYTKPSPKYGNAFNNGFGSYSGKTLGGTSAINGMIWICGCDENYDNWAKAANDSEWSYRNFLKYIKKPQGLKGRKNPLNQQNCGNFQGNSGPVVLSNIEDEFDNLSPIVKNAAEELGYNIKPSVNCGRPFTGFGNVPMSMNSGRRQCAARSYIHPIAGYENIYLMLNSFVSKVTTVQDSSGAWAATGVIVHTSLSKCPTIKIQASREVIISAGSYNSPLILLRSGIGKAKDLKKCNINQISDVPTGENLADHISAPAFYTMPGSHPTVAKSTLWVLGQLSQYLNNFSGELSRIQGLNTAGFINTLDPNANCADIQIEGARTEQNTPDLFTLLNYKQGYKPEYAEQILNINKKYAFIQMTTTVINSKSTGTVKLGSCTDPYAGPIINGNHFSDPRDLDTLVKGLLFVCKLFNATVALDAGMKPFNPEIEECNSLAPCTDPYFRCFAKYFAVSGWHPTGTCRMGTNAMNGVVDNRLRVFGVKKLRVADASIMPSLPAGNTQCPTYAIGEKAADMIISDNREICKKHQLFKSTKEDYCSY